MARMMAMAKDRVDQIPKRGGEVTCYNDQDREQP